jgi:outer membrane protein TolC
MTAVRRLTFIFCLTASTLLAQTTSKTTKKGTTGNTSASTTSTAATSEPATTETSATAETPTRPATQPIVVETDRDLENPRALRLSLDDAVRATVKDNLGVELTRYDYRESGQLLRGAYGPFDWNLTAGVSRTSTQAPTSSELQASRSSTTIVDYGLNQFLPTGGSYTLVLNSDKSSSNNPFSTVNPSIGSLLRLSVTQPLLRNFGVDVNTRGITIARNNLGISNEAFRLALMNTTDAVEQAYLDLIYARRNVEVAKEALFLARDQERITQIRIDVGASAPLDILQPRVAVATRDEELISAQALVRNAEDRIRQLMNLPMTDWDRPILPTDTTSYTPFEVTADSAVAQALRLRPEVREIELALANRKINYLYAKNQVLPRLDLNLNYGLSGQGGLERDQNGNVISDTGIRSALSQISSRDFPGWTIGFNVAIPVTNIGARAEKKRAELDVQRTVVDRANVEQGISVDVRQAVRNIDTAAKQIGATRTAREAAERNLEAERKRYENGMTTNFNVLQIQSDLSNARRGELQALIGYEKFIADYHRAVGDLLDVRNISVQPPDQVSTPNWLPFTNRSFLNYGNYTSTEVPAR